jgi:hypothetical protein
VVELVTLSHHAELSRLGSCNAIASACSRAGRSNGRPELYRLFRNAGGLRLSTCWDSVSLGRGWDTGDQGSTGGRIVIDSANDTVRLVWIQLRAIESRIKTPKVVHRHPQIAREDFDRHTAVSRRRESAVYTTAYMS